MHCSMMFFYEVWHCVIKGLVAEVLKLVFNEWVLFDNG